jgi:hypothetical protein
MTDGVVFTCLTESNVNEGVPFFLTWLSSQKEPPIPVWSSSGFTPGTPGGVMITWGTGGTWGRKVL